MTDNPKPDTIWEVLTRPNPPLRLLDKGGAVTYSAGWVPITASRVTPWADFTFQNLLDAYRPLLDVGPVEGAHFPRGSTPAEIRNESHVDSVADHWIINGTRDSLKMGTKELQRTACPEINDLSFALKPFQIAGETGAWIPDLAVFHRDSQQEKETPFVVGDNKCSSKWKSTTLEGGHLSSKTRFRPLSQVATYGKDGGTRYGFIFTPEELVAVRLFRGEANTIMTEWASVPWGNSGPGVLTVNLAVWWLGMMSLNRDHRPVKGRRETFPLNVWWESEDPKTGQSVFEHHLSGRVLDRLPVGGEARRKTGETSEVGAAVSSQYIAQLPVPSGKRKRSSKA